MIQVSKIIKPPKDFDTMISRKNGQRDFALSGVVVNKKSGKGYNVEIQMDTKHLTMQSNVKVACTCDDFKFRWAAVLYKQGALLNPNHFRLDEPKKTNPSGELNACKHIHTFMKTEMDKTLKSFSAKSGKL